MSTTKIVLRTLVGLCIGAIAGILFAPENGANTRKKISGKGGDYADDLKAKLMKFWNFMSEKLDSAKEETEDFAFKGKSKFDQTKKAVKNTALEVKDSVSNNF